MVMKNTFRLSQLPPNYFLDSFEKTKIDIRPFREGGHFRKRGKGYVRVETPTNDSRYFEPLPEIGFCTVGEGDFEIEIYFDSVNGQVSQHLIPIAREILKSLIELDSLARSQPDDFDNDELLAYINFSETEVKLHYFATTVNSEWSVLFKRTAPGIFEYVRLG